MKRREPVHERVSRAVRYAFFLICAVQLGFAVAFFWRWPAAIRWWPFPGTTPLTYAFVSSFFAAAAASTLWAVASRTYGALAGIGLDYVTIMAPVAIVSYGLGDANGNPQFITFAILLALGALFGLALLSWSARISTDSRVRVPGLVRWSFVAFIIVLLIVSVRLILKTPNIMPWSITPELSVVIGWMFAGAAAYFTYGLLRPGWRNAAGQLAGFLAYDLVLIVPLVRRLPVAAGEQRVSLILYLAIVTYSGLLAFYYLFVHRPTRILGVRNVAP